MKRKQFAILAVSCAVLIIAIFLYRTGRPKELSPDGGTAAESGMEHQFMENSGEKSENGGEMRGVSEIEIKTETDSGTSENVKTESGTSENAKTENSTSKNVKTENGTSKNTEMESGTPQNTETENGTSKNAETQSSTPNDLETQSAAADSTEETPENAFYYTELTDDIRHRITGKSYPDTEEPLQISYEDLAYVHVLHYGFDGQVQEGELICNQAIAQDLVEIFRALYDNQYPIEKIRLVDEYGADDESSMADNNTSCFNYRTVPNKTTLSNHSYGRAIDINPLYNPYVRTKNGEILVSPDNAAPYADRGADFPYKIDQNDLCYKLFIQHGFRWGGAWNSSKDYQHFEKTG